MVKHRIDIEAGRQLRKIGWSHADIALYLGCSEDWCRHNLSDVKKDSELMQKVADWQLTKHRNNKSPEVLQSLLSELG